MVRLQKHSCFCFTIWETVADETSKHFGLKWSPDRLLDKGLPKDIAFIGFQKEEGKQSKKQRDALYNTLKAKNACLPKDDRLDIKTEINNANCGRIHYQGYIQTYNNQDCTYKRIQNILGCEWAYCAIARGSSDQNQAYISKLETSIAGSYQSMGSLQDRQGYRTDWDKVTDMANAGDSTYSIINKFPNKLPYINAINQYVMLAQEEIHKTTPFKKKNVEVLFGEAGVNKTRYVMDTYDNKEAGYVYKYNFSCSDTSKMFFDGYTGQKTLLIDDFKGQILPTVILDLLDGYKLRLNIKNGHAYAKFENVIITSNDAPQTWYRHGVRKNLHRRISTCHQFTINETGDIIKTPYIIPIAIAPTTKDPIINCQPTHAMYNKGFEPY